MSLLFSPLTLRSVGLSNRIMVSPMCQYSAEDGCANDWHMIHIGTMSLSGAGLLCIEATAVEPEGRITPGCLGLWNKETEQALGAIISAVRRYSTSTIVLQLSHAGRKSSSQRPWDGGALIPLAEGGWLTYGSSATPHREGERPPEALDEQGLERIRKAFAQATERAVCLGIDGIEIHGAHGYLLHQFLSPVSNHRTDAYGGSRENRMRFPLEVFDVVRTRLPASKPLGFRVSATDWLEHGWNLEDTVALANELKKRGVDWIDVSTGGISPQQQIVIGPGYQVPYAEEVRAKTGVKTISVGLITDPHQAESILKEGKADIIALGRGLLYDPRWPWHAAAVLGGKIDAPPQYWRASPREHQHIYRETAFGMR